MANLRKILLGIIAVAAVAVTFLMVPTPTTITVSPTFPTTGSQSATSHSSDIAGAIANGELNNGSAQGAPQQTVVNGWTARDLLAVIGHQMDEQNSLIAQSGQNSADVVAAIAASSKAQTDAIAQLAAAPIDRRPTILLMLGVLALVVIGLTQQTGGSTPLASASAPTVPNAPPVGLPLQQPSPPTGSVYGEFN
jgi:hypothetical protein